MNKFAFTAITASAFVAAALGFAGTAAASSSTGGGSASDTIGNLQRQGYSVQINGSVSAPLSECIATDVHGASSSSSSGTVYVDVSCHSVDN
ncbi:MAG: hypothetical protein ACRDUS_01765 [Mycobacterium sp.]